MDGVPIIVPCKLRASSHYQHGAGTAVNDSQIDACTSRRRDACRRRRQKHKCFRSSLEIHMRMNWICQNQQGIGLFDLASYKGLRKANIIHASCVGLAVLPRTCAKSQTTEEKRHEKPKKGHSYQQLKQGEPLLSAPVGIVLPTCRPHPCGPFGTSRNVVSSIGRSAFPSFQTETVTSSAVTGHACRSSLVP